MRNKKLVTEYLAPYLTQPTDKCWIWTAAKYFSGYAKCKWRSPYSTQVYTRLSRVILVSKLGRDLTHTEYAQHTCDNPGCVNPNHIIVGNAVSNNRDTVLKGHWVNGQLNKINTTTKLKICKLYASGKFTQQKLAVQFGVSQVRISQIVRRSF